MRVFFSHSSKKLYIITEYTIKINKIELITVIPSKNLNGLTDVIVFSLVTKLQHFNEFSQKKYKVHEKQLLELYLQCFNQ